MTEARQWQEAVNHPPGRFSAVCVFKKRPKSSLEEVRSRAAGLIRLFSDRASLPDELYVSVALGPGMMEGVDGFVDSSAPLLKRHRSTFNLSREGDLLVQIDGQSDLHRTYALRIVSLALEPVALLVREIAGARILNAQEPFGFVDWRSEAHEEMLARPELDVSGLWLVYIRFRQDLEKFFAENRTARSRARVMGRVPAFIPDEDETADPAAALEKRGAIAAKVAAELELELPPDSHFALMRRSGTLPMLRRGFPYRQDGQEGLVFVALVPNLGIISEALDTMLGGEGSARDRLLDYIEALEGGVYFCPPADAAWLAAGEGVVTRRAGDPLERSPHLMVYDTTSGFVEWMLTLRERGVFDQVERPTGMSEKARPLLDKLYAEIDPERAAELRALEDTAVEQAVDVNANGDDYITFG